MPRITDVVKDLWVTKATFSRYYEKVMWKDMTAKTATVSDANLVKIKKLLEKNGKLSNKKDDKKDLWSGALKSDELMGGGFLAWLWFEKTIEEPKEEDDPNEIIEDLTEEEKAEVQQYIEREFEPKKEEIIKPVVKKSTMEVTKDDIISHSGRPAPKQITYDKPRYNNRPNQSTRPNSRSTWPSGSVNISRVEKKTRSGSDSKKT